MVKFCENFIETAGLRCSCFDCLHATDDFLLPGTFGIGTKLRLRIGHIEKNASQHQSLRWCEFQGIPRNIREHLHGVIFHSEAASGKLEKSQVWMDVSG